MFLQYSSKLSRFVVTSADLLPPAPPHEMEAPVLVTGANGYVATHLIQQLLKRRRHVRGTVRDLKNTKKVKKTSRRQKIGFTNSFFLMKRN